MNLKEAIDIIDEMIEYCNDIDDDLTDAAEGIYRDVHAAKTIESIINSANELMVFVNDTPWKSYELEEQQKEIEILYNKLLENFEDFE